MVDLNPADTLEAIAELLGTKGKPEQRESCRKAIRIACQYRRDNRAYDRAATLPHLRQHFDKELKAAGRLAALPIDELTQRLWLLPGDRHQRTIARIQLARALNEYLAVMEPLRAAWPRGGSASLHAIHEGHPKFVLAARAYDLLAEYRPNVAPGPYLPDADRAEYRDLAGYIYLLATGDEAHGDGHIMGGDGIGLYAHCDAVWRWWQKAHFPELHPGAPFSHIPPDHPARGGTKQAPKKAE